MERGSKRSKTLFSVILTRDTAGLTSLLKAGADPNCTNKRGWTPLMLAVSTGNLSLIKPLVDHGAQINAASLSGDYPFVMAARKGFLRVIKYLASVENTDVEIATQSGFTALMYAIKAGNVKMVTFLLNDQRVKNFDVIIDQNKSALHWAVERGYVEIVKHLVKRGASTNIVDSVGRTPLMYGYEKSELIRFEIVKWLVQNGKTDVNLLSNSGKSALFYECERGCFEIVEFLTKNGAVITDECKESASTVKIKMFLRTFEKHVQLMIVSFENENSPQLESVEYKIDDELTVFDTLLYCEQEYRYIDFDENIVFIVFNDNLQYQRSFCYDIEQMRRIIAEKEFVYESDIITNGLPQLDDLSKPCVPYMKISESCHYYLSAKVIAHVLAAKLNTVALVPGKRFKSSASIDCVMIQNGLNYKGEYPETISRLHGQEGSDLETFVVKRLTSPVSKVTQEKDGEKKK